MNLNSYRDCYSMRTTELLPLSNATVQKKKNYIHFRKTAEVRLLISSCMSVCQSVRVEQLGSHWTDFYEIWYLSICLPSDKKIRVWKKPDKSEGSFIWIRTYFMINDDKVFLEWEMFKTNLERKTKHIFCVQRFFFLQKLYRLTWIFRKWEGVVGTGWSWLRIGAGGGRLWIR